MAVKIRLRRMGSRNKPFYRIIAADSRSAMQGRFLEQLGWYDPKMTGTNFDVKIDRIDYWLNCGAIMSDTVSNLVKRSRKNATQTPEETPAQDVQEPANVQVEEEPAEEQEQEPVVAETKED